jgi:predicted nucleotidyltransferase
MAKKQKKKKKLKKVKKAHRVSMPRGASYGLNPNFEFFFELRDLILKSSPAETSRMIKKINSLGRVKLAIASGIFLSDSVRNINGLNSGTDLFIVCDDLDKRKLRSFLKALEAEVGKEIKFSVMEKEEFDYRYAMFDRFVRVLLEGPHEKLINKIEL